MFFIVKKIAIFFGGDSNEHEISVITGMFAVNLLKEKYQVLPVFLPREGGMWLTSAYRVEEYQKLDKKKYLPVFLGDGGLYDCKRRKKRHRIDVALNCCHGGFGEDGTLSALLAWYQIPCASPTTLPSSVFMNKHTAKIVARGLNVSVLPSLTLYEKTWREELSRQTVLYPVVVKPCMLGSSIGVQVAKNEEELFSALELGFTLDESVLVELYLEGKRDINCAAYRKEGKVILSQLEEVFSGEEILTFAEKYEGTEQRTERPARVSEDERKQIEEAVTRLYENFNLQGVVRADFLLANGRVYFNELNTVPGSLACYLFENSLTGVREFFVSLVEEAKPVPKKARVVTGVLSADVFHSSKGCKRR